MPAEVISSTSSNIINELEFKISTELFISFCLDIYKATYLRTRYLPTGSFSIYIHF